MHNTCLTVVDQTWLKHHFLSHVTIFRRSDRLFLHFALTKTF